MVYQVRKSGGAGFHLDLRASASSFVTSTLYVFLSLVTLGTIASRTFLHAQYYCLGMEYPPTEIPWSFLVYLHHTAASRHSFQLLLSNASFSPAWYPCPNPHLCSEAPSEPQSTTTTTIGSSQALQFAHFFLFLGPHLWHMEVPRWGVKSELQLTYTTGIAAARQDPSCICDLHHSSRQPTEKGQGSNPYPHGDILGSSDCWATMRTSAHFFVLPSCPLFILVWLFC